MGDTVKTTKLVLDKNERIAELEEENRKLKEELEKEDKAKMDALNGMSDLSNFGLEQIKKLEEELDFFKEQATLWRNDYKNEYEENKNLKERVKQLEERLDNKEKVNKQLREEIKDLNKMMLFETELEK